MNEEDEKKASEKFRDVFLDITDRVLTSSEPADERGLLSFVLDPYFINNGFIYVCYSAKSDNPSMDHKTIVSKFKANLDNLKKINKNSEKKILEIEQPGPRQNGGQIFFGQDGYLYVATGDGGDLSNKRFDKKSLLGKVLRIDVGTSCAESSKNYCIPDDNPFLNEKHAKEEIYAYGFRNPWRCCLDKGNPLTGYGLGRIICGDNGEENPYEEINLIVSGGRYGWMELEDSKCDSLRTCKTAILENNFPPEDQLPLYEYTHPEGQAIVGIAVYRGQSIPFLSGKIVYADFVKGSLHYLEEISQSNWVSRDLNVRICEEDNQNVNLSFIIGLSLDDKGEIIVMKTQSLRSSSPTGIIYRLITDLVLSSSGICNPYAVLIIVLLAKNYVIE